MSIISINSVSKSFGNAKALDNVSFSVEKGTIFALLGPNGAGKTTLVKSLLGLVKLSEGDMRINGIDSQQKEARSNIGYLPEKFSFYEYYTVDGVMKFFGQIQGLSGAQLNDQISESLARLGMGEFSKKKVKSLSKGQMQRVGIASLLIGNNNLLILDEPFSGLDPIGIKDLKNLLKELSLEGKTIFINSHILAEMEILADSFALLNKGELLVTGKISEVLNGASLEDYFYDKVKNRDEVQDEL